MNRAKKHELERNVLADRIESVSASVQPVLPAILGVIAIVAVGSIMWGVYSSSVKRSQSAAWTEYYFNLSGGDADTYLDVADAYPKSEMSGWARLAAADNYLHKGIDALYINRPEGEDNLKLAISTYEKVTSQGSGDELRAKAIWGLAQAHESLGDLEQAGSYYEEFAQIVTQRELKNAAAARLAFITSPSGKNFYEWFNQLEPKPDAPIELPSNLSLPPMTPDLQFDVNDLIPSGSGSSSTDSDAATSGVQPGSSSDTSSPEIDPATLPDLDLSAPPAEQSGDIDSLKLPGSDSEDSGSSSSDDS